GRIAQAHGRGLENARHHLELFPVLFLRLHQHQHDVCADAEVWSLISDHEAEKILIDFAERKLQHLQRVAADGIHLRMKLETSDTVAEIDQRSTRILLDHAAAILCRLENQ